MKKALISFGIVGATMFGLAGVAQAACTTTTAKDDLSDEQVVELYECIKSKMRAGYKAVGNEWAAAYPDWGAAFVVPGGVGNHGSRFLTTFVNEVGFSEYVRFTEEDTKMPVGTVIAKESFNVDKKGNVRVGPLFFMEKVAAGEADEFGNWLYSAVQSKGKPMKIKQSFCHGCHGNFEGQDALGYPEEEYRISVAAD